MKEIELGSAHASLADYARDLGDAPLIVTRRGRPLAALVPIPNADHETVALSTNPEFLAIIDRSRASLKAEGGIPAEEMRQRLGLAPRRKRRKNSKRPRGR